MTFYYPQAAMSLRILFEDFNSQNVAALTEQKMSVVPKDLRVNINDYTKADTFSAELDYRNFPFDPRAIRALGVTVHMQDMRSLVDENGRPRQLEMKDQGAIKFVSGGEDNVVFMGFADEESIEFDDSRRVIRLEGRDFTSLLIDAPYENKEPIPLTTPLNLVFQQLLAGLKSTQNILVETRGVTNFIPIAAFAPDYNPLAGQRNKKKNESYWDVIQDLARLAGLIVFIERDRLVVTKPNALYDRAKLKQFVWGKNLSKLSFKRKLGRVKNFNVLVRSMDIEKKRVIEAKIPEDAEAAWAVGRSIPKTRVQIETLLPNGSTDKKDAPFLSFRIPDVTEKSQLVDIGQSIFEELGRQQIEGKIETKDMCVREGEVGFNDLGTFRRSAGVEFDVLKIKNATPIAIHIHQDDLEGISRITSVADRVKYLVARKYDPQVAFAFAATMGKFEVNFYTKAVEFSFNQENGFAMKLDFINFIELPQSLLGL